MNDYEHRPQQPGESNEAYLARCMRERSALNWAIAYQTSRSVLGLVGFLVGITVCFNLFVLRRDPFSVLHWAFFCAVTGANIAVIIFDNVRTDYGNP